MMLMRKGDYSYNWKASSIKQYLDEMQGALVRRSVDDIFRSSHRP